MVHMNSVKSEHATRIFLQCIRVGKVSYAFRRRIEMIHVRENSKSEV